MLEKLVQPCVPCLVPFSTSLQLPQGGTGKSSKHTLPHLYRLTHALTLCVCVQPHMHRHRHTWMLMSVLVYPSLYFCLHSCFCGQKWVFSLWAANRRKEGAEEWGGGGGWEKEKNRTDGELYTVYIWKEEASVASWCSQLSIMKQSLIASVFL